MTTRDNVYLLTQDHLGGIWPWSGIRGLSGLSSCLPTHAIVNTNPLLVSQCVTLYVCVSRRVVALSLWSPQLCSDSLVA